MVKFNVIITLLGFLLTLNFAESLTIRKSLQIYQQNIIQAKYPIPFFTKQGLTVLLVYHVFIAVLIHVHDRNVKLIQKQNACKPVLFAILFLLKPFSKDFRYLQALISVADVMHYGSQKVCELIAQSLQAHLHK